MRDRFLAAILDGDFSSALVAAQEARTRSLAFLYESVVVPALAEVGRRWQAGRISVADEHVATALTQSVIASFYPSFPWATTGPRAIVACVAGERHELGARMAADLLSCDGWNVTYLGSDVPLDALVARVEREAPVVVGLSVTLSEHLPELREAIARVRRAAPSTKVLVGGHAAAGVGTPSDLGADRIALTAAGAVEAIRPWKP